MQKPIEVEAIQWTGENEDEIKAFCSIAVFLEFKKRLGGYSELMIPTFDGDLYVQVGDYLVKDANGNFCHCTEDTFKQYYEKI